MAKDKETHLKHYTQKQTHIQYIVHTIIKIYNRSKNNLSLLNKGGFMTGTINNPLFTSEM